MKDLTLSESELRIMDIIWDNAPLGSGELVKLCEAKLGWKKSTTYTMLHKVIDKELVKNEDSIVSFIIDRSHVQKSLSNHLVERSFGGSLSAFVSAFLGNGRISREDADALIDLINEHLDEK
ncbi:MAG: BlaI/MecI/CopY family transcriptional regulator [Lachnospiraceae bacterium]|nr:BlaI/MecI/CopY family transcriptional regulator [Lachnospiraceae bacterium]